ncbi:hypothetical protein NHJ13051_003805 [Beauveria bassiana]
MATWPSPSPPPPSGQTGGSKPPGKVSEPNTARQPCPGGVQETERFPCPWTTSTTRRQYEPHSDDFFPLRYFSRVPPLQSLAAPVIVIAGGEVTGEYHRPLLTNSVGALLARGHLGPAARPGAPLLRQQLPRAGPAVADAAFFAQHARFPGLEDPGPDRGAHAMDHLRPVQAGVPRRRKIVDMHDQQVAFVKAWFNEFHDSKGGSA